MVWLGAYEMRKSEAVELRLYAPQKEKQFFQEFLEWLDEALTYTNIIVVEGNL